MSAHDDAARRWEYIPEPLRKQIKRLALELARPEYYRHKKALTVAALDAIAATGSADYATISDSIKAKADAIGAGRNTVTER